jgi:hypothetical protein
MTLDEFRATLSDEEPPQSASRLLTALWHDARDDWSRAHQIAQDIETEDAAWVHAYLHRKEGDPGNAAYWYRRARRPVCGTSLDGEWAEIATSLLAR